MDRRPIQPRRFRSVIAALLVAGAAQAADTVESWALESDDGVPAGTDRETGHGDLNLSGADR